MFVCFATMKFQGTGCPPWYTPITARAATVWNPVGTRSCLDLVAKTVLWKNSYDVSVKCSSVPWEKGRTCKLHCVWPLPDLQTQATVSSLMFTWTAFRSLSSRIGLAAADNAILKEKSSIVNSHVESYSLLLLPDLLSTPSWWDHSSGYLNCRRRKTSFIFPRSHWWSPESHLRWSHWHICHCFNAFSRGRDKKTLPVIARLHRTSGEQNTSVKGERIFLKTQSHTNDLDSWLNIFPGMKIYCVGTSYNRWLESRALWPKAATRPPAPTWPASYVSSDMLRP